MIPYIVYKKIDSLEEIAKLKDLVLKLLGSGKKLIEYPSGIALVLSKEEYEILFKNKWQIQSLTNVLDPYGLVEQVLTKSP
ncbi:hypothetical protein HOE31_03065 [bacterium]|jgi:hypothetical protein|nr:hypothetical protein [bacterium]MBT4495326.1 hypothetical protein [bacterium]MBT4763756.1 hypothetical protein [bacterium]MBT5401126.1 hypothetical protein [bacterium]MBT5942914.1 hypothetical protein [bacterium]